MRLIAFIIITLGLLMIIIPGFIMPVKKNILKAGPIEINKTENTWVGWPAYSGGLLLVGGILLVIIDSKQKK